MPTFLSGIAGKALLGVGILALIVMAYLRYEAVVAERDAYKTADASDKAAISQLQQVNQQSQDALAKLKDDYAKASSAQAEAAAEAQQRADELSRIQQDISHAPKSDRGAVPGVIAHVIDGLLEPASPGGRH